MYVVERCVYFRLLMAAASDNNGMYRPAGSPQLGAILVKRGVLSEDQLAAALAEQEQSGEQLGEIIVRLGFAAGPLIAQALATQYGRLLKTEYGYAVGFDDAAARPSSPPPVSSVPARAEQSADPTPVAGLRVAPPVQAEQSADPTPAAGPRVAPPAQSAPGATPSTAQVPATPPVPVKPTPDEVVLKWQHQAQQLAAQRDAALRDLQAVADERAASAAELEAVTARCTELEAAAAEFETSREAVLSSHDQAVQRNAELERRLGEVEATASARMTELGTTATAAEREKAALERARDEAALRIAELEQRVAELEAAAAADDGHLTAATARVAELESALAAGENELDTALASGREEAARIQMEKAALQEAHDAVASRNADLEGRLKELDAAKARATQLERQLEEAATQITNLEAERNDAGAAAQLPGQEQHGRHHPDNHAKDPSHLLFVAGPEGYRLVELDGPPPMPGSTLELPEDDGTSSRLVVSKVGPAPLPSVRLACAYLVAAE